MYWIHRLFHRAELWRFHAVHHSAEEVDWTTAYRFHPVNLWLGPLLVDALMLFLGIPVIVICSWRLQQHDLRLCPCEFEVDARSAEIRSRTPVFHRWHHTPPDQGGNSNFGSLFSLWDVLFRTFHMPEHVPRSITASTIRGSRPAFSARPSIRSAT